MSAAKYGLFRRKRGTKRWERVEGCSPYQLATARKVYQNRLIAGAMSQDYEFRLRPVKDNGGV